MEDRIFGYYRDTSSGAQTQLDTPLKSDVVYDVTYPVTGVDTLIVGRWEDTAIKSVTDKLSKYGCDLLYMSLDPMNSVLRVQFGYTDTTIQGVVSDLISYMVTFGVTPQITLSKPDTIVATPTVLAKPAINPQNIGVVVGVVAVLGAIAYLGLNTKRQ